MTDMALDMLADMEVDKVADMAAEMFKTKCIGPKLFDPCLLSFASLLFISFSMNCKLMLRRGESGQIKISLKLQEDGVDMNLFGPAGGGLCSQAPQRRT